MSPRVGTGVYVSDEYLVINYYGPQMYEALGLSAHQSLLVQGIYGAIGPIANLLSVSLSHLLATVTHEYD